MDKNFLHIHKNLVIFSIWWQMRCYVKFYSLNRKKVEKKMIICDDIPYKHEKIKKSFKKSSACVMSQI